MANTYPSLSVKGMIYIHSGSPQICVSSQKTAQGRRGRSEDPVYTACGPKICMGMVVCDVFKSQMHNFDGPPTTLQTEHRTRLQAWFNTYDVGFPTSRRRGGVVQRMRSNFIWSNMAHIAIGNHHGQTLLVVGSKG